MIQKIIQKIKKNDECSLVEINWLKDCTPSFNLLALYYHAIFNDEEFKSIIPILESKIDNKYWHKNILCSDINKKYQNIIRKVLYQEFITKKEFDFLSQEIINNVADYNLLAIFVVCVYYHNLDDETTNELTKSMLYSGNIYDYRSQNKHDRYKIVRRYPTGALSEKIALILPAILSHYSKKFNIRSPFLVAKSLGFTGGTWDKLRSIPNIEFIEQGDKLIDVLKNIGTAYCMTGINVAPVDRFLYEFRSLTGTIENDSLIVSSIASKQLAIPADILVMDIRYGEGAFLANYKEATQTGENLKTVLSNNGMSCVLSYTDTSQPNGVCIGNYWETYEAICLLKGIYKNEILKYEISKQQIELVIKMFLLIIQELKENIDLHILEQEVTAKLGKGVFYADFLRILGSNKVREETIDSCFFQKNSDNFFKSVIYNSKSGVISKLRQKEIGNYINFFLGNNNYDLDDNYFNYSGMILNACVGEKVKEGEILCTVIHSKGKVIDHNYVNSLFVIN